MVEPDGLHPERQIAHHAENRPLNQVVESSLARECRAQTAEEQRGQDRTRGQEPKPYEVGRLQNIHGIFHDHEAQTPDDGSHNQQELVNACRNAMRYAV